MNREEQGRVLELIDTVAKRHCHDYEEIEYQEGYEQAIFEIKEAVEDCDLEERKKGKWERHYIRPGVYADLWFHAACCGSVMSFVTDYCPHCGARMIKEDEQDARK